MDEHGSARFEALRRTLLLALLAVAVACAWLNPLNDLVERFSDLMLMASVAFGVQLLLLEMGMHWGMSLALTLAALAWACLYWKRLDGHPPPPPFPGGGGGRRAACRPPR